MKSILYLREPVKMPIALYGAGEAGSQVLDNLRSSSEYIPVALFDDDPVKWGTFVNSMWVDSSDEMGDIIKKKDIKLILLSIIGISHEKRREILKNISQFPVQVRMIVGIDNLISGDFDLNHIQSVDVKDILGEMVGQGKSDKSGKMRKVKACATCAITNYGVIDHQVTGYFEEN